MVFILDGWLYPYLFPSIVTNFEDWLSVSDVKYVASIILEPSDSLPGRHAQKSSGVEIVASISLYLH